MSPKSFLISDTMGYMDFPQDGLIGPMDSPPQIDGAEKIPRKLYNYLELIQGFTIKVAKRVGEISPVFGTLLGRGFLFFGGEIFTLKLEEMIPNLTCAYFFRWVVQPPTKHTIQSPRLSDT